MSIDYGSQEKMIRVWVDGCFDMMHFGHANALRQARALGHFLVVGVHSDNELIKHKGCPVMNEQERYATIRACEWTDQVVEDAPYVTSLEMMDLYQCDFCVHGDDLVFSSTGIDPYEEVKKANRFRTIPRTQGISTTHLLTRLLSLGHNLHRGDDPNNHHPSQGEGVSELTNHIHLDSLQLPPRYNSHSSIQDSIHSLINSSVSLQCSRPSSLSVTSPYIGFSKFQPTTEKIVQFMNGRGQIQPYHSQIIFVDGAFDLLHIGHLRFLEAAKSLGDYLIVGVWSDDTVLEKQGRSSVMTLFERIFGVLSCKYVNNVIIDSPSIITSEFLAENNISLVVKGTVQDPSVAIPSSLHDPYHIPKSLKKFRIIESPCSITTHDIVMRIFNKRLIYQERNQKKQIMELKEIEAKSNMST